MPKPVKILLVEDDPNDIELILTALRENHLAKEVDVARDGEEALNYLFRRGAYEPREAGEPAVVLLDLKLPKVSGMEVLERIKDDPKLGTLPVVVLTSSREEHDVLSGYDLGTNAYVVKPVDFTQFGEAIRRLGLFWAVVNHPPPGSTGERQ